MIKLQNLKKIVLSDDFTYFLIFLVLCGFFAHTSISSLRIIPGILLIIVQILRYFLNIEVRKSNYKPFFYYFLWGGIFLLYSGLSLFWTIDRTYSLQLLKDMFYTLTFILIIMFFITDANKLKKVINIFIVTCVYSSLLILIFNWDLVGSDAFGSITGLHFNRIALLLCYAMFFCFYFYKKTHHLKYIVSIILFYFVIYLTGSRKTIIMPIAFFGLFLLLNIGKDKKKFMKAIISMICLLGIVAVLINVNPKLKTEMNNLFQSIVYAEKTNDGSINERDFFRETAITLFEQNPIIGIGANGFRGYLNSINYRHVTYAHCNQLELLATLGILGFLIYYFLYIIIIKNSVKSFKANNLEKVLGLSFILIEFVFEYGFVSFYFFEIQFVLALLYLCSSFKNENELKQYRKIGIMIPSLNTGGAERTAVALANWLAVHTKDEIYLINLGKNDHNYVIENTVKVYNKKFCLDTKSKIKEYIKLIKYLNKIQFDILFEMLFSPLKYALIHGIFNGRVVIIGSERANPKRYNTLFKKIRCRFYPLFCDGYIFQTKTVQNMFPWIIRRKSVVIANAISNPDIAEIKIEAKEKEEIIVAVGRLTQQKGFDTLINSFIKVHDKYPEYKLVIYGEGPMRKELEEYIHEKDMENFIFLPGNKKNVLEYVASATMFVMSSRYEGMPNALLEAMAIGMPCISTNCISGPSEIITNDENGVLVDVDNVDEMAREMIKIIEDKTFRDKISTNALKINKVYSVDKIYLEYYSYFLKVYNQKNFSYEKSVNVNEK